MRDLYSDDYESVAVDGADRLVPDGLKKLAAATLFLALIATMALWSYRLGTRDATEVPVIKAAEGPSRIQPDDPGGLQAAHQGLEVNSVLAGRPAPMPQHLKPAPAAPAALAGEDAPQGDLVLRAPAALTRQVLGEDTHLPMPQPESRADEVAAADLPPAPDDAEAASDADRAADIQRPRNRPANLAAARSKVTPVSVTKPSATDSVPKVTATAAQKTASTPKQPIDKPTTSAATKEVAGLATGTRLVQLGAFDSEAITRQAWAQLVARNDDLLGSKSLFVERTTANARVFYRLRVAGFQSADQTRALCEALRARGTACIPVTLQ